MFSYENGKAYYSYVNFLGGKVVKNRYTMQELVREAQRIENLLELERQKSKDIERCFDMYKEGIETAYGILKLAKED